jgi:CRISPR-associated protein Cst1
MDINHNKGAGYQWTNHPLIDMGIASLLAFSGRKRPAELLEADLERFARYAEDAYFTPELASYLTVLFTSNFINPSFKPRRKREFASQVLRVFREEVDTSLPPCSYCAQQPTRMAHRDLVPMLTGREAINFFPNGAPGIPLCGKCLLALQALSIGAPMCGGRALIVSCDDPQLTLELVKTWQPQIRKRIQLSRQKGEKLPIVSRPLTRTVEALLSIEAMRQDEQRDEWKTSLTVFHLSNSGQGPQVDIFFLPSSVVGFLQKARAARYADAWKEFTEQALETPPKPKKGQVEVTLEPTAFRNYLYEDLFSLPDQAGRFIRTYFLRKATRYAQGPGDPRPSYPGWKANIKGTWELTELFLREVLGMDAQRIEAIRKLGSQIAEEIATENDRRLWWNVYSAENYRAVRLTLIRTSERRLKRGESPIVSFDEFLQVFEEGEELPRIDWRLAWDLVLIRVIESLYEQKWFEKNKEVLEEIDVKEA